jgi:PKD repeat protein
MIPEREQGVSELIGTILVIILVIAIAGIIAALVFGWSIPLQRTPYFVSEATPIENASVVKLFHAQGDPVSLYPGATQGLPMKMTLASGAVTYDVTPLPTAAGKGWRAGETLYIFRNASGVWIADSPALILNSTGFAPGPWRLSLVDITSNVLIVQHTLDLAGDGDGPVPLPPVAEFTATPTSGTAPLTVQFTDLSTNDPISWNWDFGDGATSTIQDPNHIYTVAGSFTVMLTTSNLAGNDTETKTGYIIVSVDQPRNTLLNTNRGGYVKDGGQVSFRVTGSFSYIDIGVTRYNLAIGDTITLLVHGDSTNVEADMNGNRISTFRFPDVTVSRGGSPLGRGAITGIWISQYLDMTSSLSIIVPSRSPVWTEMVFDGITLIYGQNGQRIELFNLYPRVSDSFMRLNVQSGNTYYNGAAVSYVIQ